MSKKPNIILVTCDQLRASSVHCYGNDVISTPNMDRLASEGLRFEHGISNNPLCMPARSAMLSGQYSRTCTGTLNNEVYRHSRGWTLPAYPLRDRPHLKDSTLMEILKPHGYFSAAIGKWHIHSWPHDVGFDYYLIPRTQHSHVGQSFTENGGPEFVPEGFTVDFEADRVGKFLAECKEKQDPFFLFYNISPPHLPFYDLPEHYRTMYKPEDMPIRKNAILDGKMSYDRYNFRSYLYDFKFYEFGLPHTKNLPDGFDLKHLYALYYGAITCVDDAIGKLLENIKKQGLEQDTIILFISDHGDNLGSHGAWQKNLFYQESSRIPYIWKVPGVTSGQVNIEQAGCQIDFVPTVLDFAGIEIPEHIQGQSLAPILRGETKALDRSYAIIESAVQGAAVRTPTHTFGKGLDKERKMLTDHATVLFDLESDPYEMNNLEASSKHKEIRAELETVLESWNSDTPWMAQFSSDEGAIENHKI